MKVFRKIDKSLLNIQFKTKSKQYQSLFKSSCYSNLYISNKTTNILNNNYIKQKNFYSLVSEKSFDDLEDLDPKLKEGIKRKGFDKMFDIQEKTWNALNEGRDLIGRAKTGSGKTLAFCLPILNRIKKNNLPLKPNRPYALVMAPTRELANQIGEEFQKLDHNIKILTVAGGKSILPQIEDLNKGVHVIIGTPGRLADHLQRGSLKLDSADRVVLDEVDVMLDKGFAEDVENILSYMNPQIQRQTMLFSATLPSWVQNISAKYLKDPVLVDLIKHEDSKIPSSVEHLSIEMPDLEEARRSLLADILTVYMKNKALIFVNKKVDADKLAETNLRQSVGVLHGDITQFKRDMTLKGFKEGKYNVLIATDVASRGLDIPFVDTVIHFELPQRGEDFIHRSGRCGRAGKSGTSIALYSKSDHSTLFTIKRETQIPFKSKPLPNINEILHNAPNSVVSKIESVDDEISSHFKEQAQSFIEEKGVEGVARALAYISGLKDFKRRSLLTFNEGYSTVFIKNSSLGQPLRESDVVSWLLDIGLPMGMAKGFSRTQNAGAVVDIPTELIEQLQQNQQDNPKYMIEVVQILPPLSSSFSSYGNRGNSGGNFNKGGSYNRDNNFRGGSSSYGNRGGSYNRDNNSSSYGNRGGSYNRDNNSSSYGNRGGSSSYGSREGGSSSYGSRDGSSSYGNRGGSSYGGSSSYGNRDSSTGSKPRFTISSPNSSRSSYGSKNSGELSKKYDDFFN